MQKRAIKNPPAVAWTADGVEVELKSKRFVLTSIPSLSSRSCSRRSPAYSSSYRSGSSSTYTTGSSSTNTSGSSSSCSYSKDSSTTSSSSCSKGGSSSCSFSSTLQPLRRSCRWSSGPRHPHPH